MPSSRALAIQRSTRGRLGTQGSGDRGNGFAAMIAQQNLCPLHPPGGFGARLGQLLQPSALLFGKFQFRASADKRHRCHLPAMGLSAAYTPTYSIAMLFWNRSTRIAAMVSRCGQMPRGLSWKRKSTHLATSVTTATDDATKNSARLLQATADPQTSITEVARLPYSRSAFLSSPREGMTNITRTRSPRKNDKFASVCQVCVTTSRTFWWI